VIFICCRVWSYWLAALLVVFIKRSNSIVPQDASGAIAGRIEFAFCCVPVHNAEAFPLRSGLSFRKRRAHIFTPMTMKPVGKAGRSRRHGHHYLHELLRLAKLTQCQLALRLGTTRDVVGAWMPGRKEIPKEMALRLEALFGIDHQALLSKDRNLKIGWFLKQEEPNRVDLNYSKQDYDTYVRLFNTPPELQLFYALNSLCGEVAECLCLATVGYQTRPGTVWAVREALSTAIQSVSKKYGLNRFADILARDATWSNSEWGLKSRVHDGVTLAFALNPELAMSVSQEYLLGFIKSKELLKTLLRYRLSGLKGVTND
jgi:plasmid maintenance system antidote protein VapI